MTCLQNQLQVQIVKKEEPTVSSARTYNVEPEDRFKGLIHALHKLKLSSDSVLCLNEDWQQVSDMLQYFPVVKEEESVKTAEGDTADTSDVHKDNSDLAQLQSIADMMDTVIDKVIIDVTDAADDQLKQDKIAGQNEEQPKEDT